MLRPMYFSGSPQLPAITDLEEASVTSLQPSVYAHKPVMVTTNSYAHCLQHSPMAFSLWAQAS